MLAIGASTTPPVEARADGMKLDLGRLRFESTDSSIVLVDGAGRVTARKRGGAFIRITAVSGASGAAAPSDSFRVRGVVARLRFSRAADTLLALGPGPSFKPGYDDANGNPLSDPDSASIRPQFSTLTSPGRAVSIDTLGAIVAKANGVDTVRATVDTSHVDLVVVVRQHPTRLGFLAQPTLATAGAAFTPAVRVGVLDPAGNPVLGEAGEIVLADSAESTAGKALLYGPRRRNAVDGIATFDGVLLIKAGRRFVLRASVAALAPVTSDSFDVSEDRPARLRFVNQPRKPEIGKPLPAETVAVLDLYGNPVANATTVVIVELATNPTGAQLGGTTTVGAVDGLAVFTDLSIDKTGSGYSLAADASGLSRAVSDTFSVVSSGATKLAFTVPPGNTQAGALITPAVQVAVQDAAGNTVTTATNAVTVAIGTNPAGGVLAGTTTVNAVNGVATFSNLSIGQVGAGYTLSASASGIAGAASTAFDVLGTGATKLAFTVPPSNTAVGAAITPAVQVAIQDAGGSTVTTATNAVTLAIGTNPGSGTLAGTTTVNAVNGVATFSNLNINAIGTGYTLTAAAGGLTGATSNTFNITAAVAAKLGFVVQPTNTQAGAALTPAVQVAVQDAAGNTVTTATNAVSVAIGTNPAGGVLAGTTTVNAVNGVATFSELSIAQAGAGYTLTAAASGLTGSTSGSFDILS
ncbi:MAG: hypothetical protein HY560_14705, partial [Gemmatimonadetes bacterium]|nr:hypothetical protein [Gemmatimonadota bacterium]